MKVAFLGPLTSFSHDASLKTFPEAELMELHSIHDVFSAVSKGEADTGVVPMENSTEGSVNTTLDLLLSNDLLISSETFIDVKHSLIGGPGAREIKKIYSHPQAFAQCQNWLMKHYPKAEHIATSSTASAAVHTAGDGQSAAIASETTAKRFGLKVLNKNIQDLSFNKTRFVVIGKKPALASPSNKTTMFFSLKDRPGALFDSLKGFKDLNINLTRLESRPSKKGAWDYVFFVEFIGDSTEPRIKKAFVELKKCAKSFKVLGSYPKKGD